MYGLICTMFDVRCTNLGCTVFDVRCTKISFISDFSAKILRGLSRTSYIKHRTAKSPNSFYKPNFHPFFCTQFF
jgi:hypothetical protein